MEVIRNPQHMNYYRLLERDLDNCFRFVEPCEAHFGVHSDEFARIILMAASEVENALHSFAVTTGTTPVKPNITGFYSTVTTAFPNFCSVEMFLPRCSLLIKPWSTWSSSSGPEWWTSGYNKIKHDRLNNPGAATLLRAINSVAALQALLLHLYRLSGPDVLIADRSIPEIIVLYERDSAVPGASTLWQWKLPDDIS